MIKNISKDADDMHYPDFKEKQDFHASGISTFRKREPTNPHTASKMTTMVFDHSRQMAVWPDSKPNSLIEATRGNSGTTYRTMNRSGHPYALGVMVGGSPDNFMDAFKKGPKAKILK